MWLSRQKNEDEFFKKIVNTVQECNSGLEGRRWVHSFSVLLPEHLMILEWALLIYKCQKSFSMYVKVILSDVICHILNGKYVDVHGTRLWEPLVLWAILVVFGCFSTLISEMVHDKQAYQFWDNKYPSNKKLIYPLAESPFLLTLLFERWDFQNVFQYLFAEPAVFEEWRKEWKKATSMHSLDIYWALGPRDLGSKHILDFRSSLFHREDKLIQTRKTRWWDGMVVAGTRLVRELREASPNRTRKRDNKRLFRGDKLS